MTCAKRSNQIWQSILLAGFLSCIFGQEVLFSNRIDALISDSNEIFAFHQTNEGSALSHIELNENLTWANSNLYEWAGIRLFTPNWPRLDSIHDVRLHPWWSSTQLFLPNFDQTGVFRGWSVFDRSELSKPSHQFILDLDMEVSAPSEITQFNDTLFFALGVDQLLGVALIDGQIPSGFALLVLDLKRKVLRECSSEAQCDLTREDPIWSYHPSSSDAIIGRQSGVYRVVGGDISVLKIYKQKPLMNLGTHVEYWKDNSSWLAAKNTTSKMDWLSIESWKNKTQWNSQAEFAIWDRQDYKGSTWYVARPLDGRSRGLLKVKNDTLQLAFDKDSPTFTDYFFLNEQGVVPQAAEISGLAIVKNESQSQMVVSSNGYGLSFYDGEKWTWLYNQKKVSAGLKEVRLIPSVMTGRSQKIQIAYRLSEDSNISIDIFNYNMEHVVNIQEDEWRLADPIRSSSPKEDVWDGTDASGRGVSSGPYFVRVKDQRGNEAWSKLLKMTGPVK